MCIYIYVYIQKYNLCIPFHSVTLHCMHTYMKWLSYINHPSRCESRLSYRKKKWVQIGGYVYIYIQICIYTNIYICLYIYIDMDTLRKIGLWINVKNRWLLSCFRTFSERDQWFFAKNFEPRLGMIGHDWAIWICLKAGYTLQIAMLMRKWWWITEWGWEMLKTP